jgi:PAS domain S-box-containing protein
LLDQDYLVVEGPENCIDVVSAVASGEVEVKFLDLLFCRGCIDGPKLKSSRSLTKKKSEVMKLFNSIPTEMQEEGLQRVRDFRLDLSRGFTDRSTPLPQPDENQIREILAQTDKYSGEDELNCGACGYPSCREKAIAVYQGIAEVEMCLPYLISKKTQLLETLQARLEKEKELNSENLAIIQCSFDGITVTDGKGNIVKVNPALEKLFGMKASELVGRNVGDLERERVIYPSATLLAIRQKKPVTFLQKLKSGKEVLATGNPVLDEEGNVVKVIVNIRDFSQLERMRDKLEEGIGDVYIQEREMEDLKLIARSPAILDLIDMAKKLAAVDSTILIYGESGTGKEVLTRLIHNSGARKNGPFVKINCGAIPENLMESELFGYETGAFTGAKRQGKPGLLEIANRGTVFLDEVGELPLSQQVKLLRVLQEKKIMRIGGTSPIDIDVRVIAATNRDLAEMVKKGDFRADLYYRLSVVPFKVPPLRERREDILPLAHYFLNRFNKKYGTQKAISERLKEILLQYNWPGNIRELENLMERLVVTAKGNFIEPKDLPRGFLSDESAGQSIEVKGILPLKKALEEVEKQLLLQAKERYNSTYKIAEMLEVNQSTIVRKLKKYSGNAE